MSLQFSHLTRKLSGWYVPVTSTFLQMHFLGRPELAALPEGRVREEAVLVDALELLFEGLREALELAELLGERRPAAREAERAPRVPEDRVEHVVDRRVIAPHDDAARLLRVRERARRG
jgi:hypothetical protein